MFGGLTDRICQLHPRRQLGTNQAPRVAGRPSVVRAGRQGLPSVRLSVCPSVCRQIESNYRPGRTTVDMNDRVQLTVHRSDLLLNESKCLQQVHNESATNRTDGV